MATSEGCAALLPLLVIWQFTSSSASAGRQQLRAHGSNVMDAHIHGNVVQGVEPTLVSRLCGIFNSLVGPKQLPASMDSAPVCHWSVPCIAAPIPQVTTLSPLPGSGSPAISPGRGHREGSCGEVDVHGGGGHGVLCGPGPAGGGDSICVRSDEGLVQTSLRLPLTPLHEQHLGAVGGGLRHRRGPPAVPPPGPGASDSEAALFRLSLAAGGGGPH